MMTATKPSPFNLIRAAYLAASTMWTGLDWTHLLSIWGGASCRSPIDLDGRSAEDCEAERDRFEALAERLDELDADADEIATLDGVTRRYGGAFRVVGWYPSSLGGPDEALPDQARRVAAAWGRGAAECARVEALAATAETAAAEALAVLEAGDPVEALEQMEQACSAEREAGGDDPTWSHLRKLVEVLADTRVSRASGDDLADELGDHARTAREEGWTPTHRITRDAAAPCAPGPPTAEQIDVMLIDGQGYTASEWVTDSAADYECDDGGAWTDRGQAFNGEVCAIVSRRAS